MTILITGATGTVSKEVLRELAGKTPVRTLVRDKSRAPDLDGVDFTNDHVARVVGRSPRTIAEFVRDRREQFARA